MNTMSPISELHIADRTRLDTGVPAEANGQISVTPAFRRYARHVGPALRSRPDSLATARDALYSEFTPLIRRLIRKYGVNSELRQDLNGEIYYRFCQLLEEFDPSRRVPLRPYIVRQLTISTYTYARKQWSIQRREAPIISGDDTTNHIGHSIDPTPMWDAELTRKQVAAVLPEAIMKLPDRQQKVVVWRYYEDKSFTEIAQLLAVEASTARSLLRHGLANLRKQMKLHSQDVL
jgi:RNA polymerase sigma factor (sigma-70 family)